MSLDILGAITGIFVIIYDGQHGLRFTLGRARAVVGPGIHFKIPFLQTFKVEETKHTTLDLEPQVIQLRDDLVYEVDCKVVYQIVNLRKAIIEIDDLVTGLQNRVVMAVQRVVSQRDRHSVRQVDEMSDGIREELRQVEDQWGVRILQFGFSNISPSPTTLEITQLELLAGEKLTQYDRLRQAGLSEEAAVALISGAVVSIHADDTVATYRTQRAVEDTMITAVEEELTPKPDTAESDAEGDDPFGSKSEGSEEDTP